MRPVLEESPLLPEQGVEEQGIIRAEATPQHEQMTAGDDVDGVKLQASEPTDYVHDAFNVSTRMRPRQALSHNGQPTGHGTRNDACLFHHHRLTSVSRAEPGTCVFISHGLILAAWAILPSSYNERTYDI